MANTPNYASAKDFKKSLTTDLTLPSGATCAARRVSLEAFLKTGNVPNGLLPMLKGVMAGDRSKLPTKVEEISPELMADSFAMFDLATVEAIVIPAVLPLPPRNEDGKRYNADGTEWVRDPEVLYVDEIDLEDKQFIFQWTIGGVTDVAKFRDGAKANLVALQTGKGVRKPAKSVAKNRR